MNAFHKKIDFPFEVRRSHRRKTASINVVEGQVEIVVPMDLPLCDIEDVLYQKRAWIREKIRLHAGAMPTKEKEYVSGEAFTYLGKNYRLKILPDGLGEVKLRAGYLELGMVNGFPVSKRDDFIKKQISLWFKRHAEKRLRDKVKRLSTSLGLDVKSVSIQDYKSRWGSCSAEGDISFNWRIIMAPHSIVDYVVAHEICHLIEHNHSPKFWKQVERLIPDYKKRKEWLRENSGSLNI